MVIRPIYKTQNPKPKNKNKIFPDQLQVNMSIYVGVFMFVPADMQRLFHMNSRSALAAAFVLMYTVPAFFQLITMKIKDTAELQKCMPISTSMSHLLQLKILFLLSAGYIRSQHLFLCFVFHRITAQTGWTAPSIDKGK